MHQKPYHAQPQKSLAEILEIEAAANIGAGKIKYYKSNTEIGLYGIYYP